MRPLPIANGFYESESLPISHQEGVNVYPNFPQTEGALSQATLYGIPGIRQLTTSGTVQQANRGSWTKNDIPYFVNGNTLYSVTRTIAADGTETFTTNTLGTVEGTGRVSMAANDTQLMILVPGGKGYIYNENAGTPFQQITDTDFTAYTANYVVYVDGYFAVTTESKVWIISNLNDGLTWSALDFGSAESDPDVIVAPVVNNNQIYITGSRTTEGFSNIGGFGFPFKRNNVFLDKGCLAPFTLINTNQSFYMIGAGKNESPAIWRFSGNSYTKVSTTAIDNYLDRLSDTELNNTFSWSYAERGAYFVGFTFIDTTFCLDIITNKWHERKSTINDTETKWRVNSMVTAYGRVMVGDSIDGRIGELDKDLYTEYGNNIIRYWSTQPFANAGNEVRVPRLELTMESGVGNSDAPDPEVSLSVSKDAKNFGPERVRKVGRIGEYSRRTIWTRNGRYARYVVFKFRLSDPIKPVFIKLEAA